MNLLVLFLLFLTTFSFNSASIAASKNEHLLLNSLRSPIPESENLRFLTQKKLRQDFESNKKHDYYWRNYLDKASDKNVLLAKRQPRLEDMIVLKIHRKTRNCIRNKKLCLFYG